MSPRPKKQRKLNEPPFITGFIPENGDFNPAQSITLFFEEYEALKLADYKGLSQLEASKMLDVSRPTFTRIYDSARKKIAQALVEHKRIRIGGGNAVFNEKWYACNSCESVFKLLQTSTDTIVCPVCQSKEVVEIQEANFGFGQRRGMGGKGRHLKSGPSGNCICPKCSYTVEHQVGIPCNSMLCPHCNIRLIRENSFHHLNIINKRNI